MKKLINSFSFLGIWLILMSCQQSEYEKLVKKELASGIKYDSIFLNFNFGDSREAFFSKGWNQNKKGLIRQGPKNMTVEYMMVPEDSLQSRIQMLFFPEFDDDNRINRMDLTFKYMGWAPWNRRYFSDSLMFAIQDTLISWYGGNEFIPVQFEDENETLWVKVDGNRRITLKIYNEQEVAGVIKLLENKD